MNTVFGVFDRFGNLTYGPSPGNILWSGFGGLCEATNNGDPIALYDPLADRWMMSQFAFQVDGSGIPVGPYAQCIAVSATGDPLGSYHRYEFVISPNRLPDYPKFGVWPDAYYYAATLFGGGSNAGVAAFERAAMLDGQPARIVYFDLGTVDARMSYALPADLDGPAPAPGTPNPYLTAGDDQSGYPSDQLQVWEFAVDWALAAP